MIATTSDTGREPDNRIAIELSDDPQTSAFGLAIGVDRAASPASIRAATPGVFRAGRRSDEPPRVRSGDHVAAGGLVGFVCVGPILTPVTMPVGGWVLAVTAHGATVGHGDDLVLILPAGGAITS